MESKEGKDAIKQTYGEKAVGIDFNPSCLTDIDVMKKKFADVIDKMDYIRSESTSAEQKRLCSVAITQIQTAQMWAVKARTWEY